jgi:shikimate kinase
MTYLIVNQVGQSMVLIGMMGSGKSFVGRCLHRRTGLPIVETDDMIASKLGMSIADIFSKHGEKTFREAETQALQEASRTRPAVVATGGGAVLRKENVKILKRLGFVVWLDGDDETLFARASRTTERPLLQTKNPRKTFSQMLGKRRPLYKKIADIRIDTSELTGEEVVTAILSKFKRTNPNAAFRRIAN